MDIAQLFTHYRAVLRLHQAIIVGVAWPALGEANQELVQELSYRPVDKLRPVIRMEASDNKGEVYQHGFQNRLQVILRYPFHRG